MNIGRKLLIPIIAVTIVTLSTIGVINYSLMSNQADKLYKEKITSAIESVEGQVQLSNTMIEYVLGKIDEKNLALSRAFAEIVKQNPDLINHWSEMERLAQLFGVPEVHVTDDKGVLYWGNIEGFYGFDFSTSGQTLEFLQILDDPTIEIAQEPQPNGATGAMFQYTGVARTDAKGIVQVGIDAGVVDGLNAMLNVQNTVAITNIGQTGYISIIEDGIITSHKNAEKIGTDVTNEQWFSQLRGGIGGFSWVTIDGEKYLAGTSGSAENLIIGVIAESEYRSDLNNLVSSTAILTVVFALLTILILYICISAFIIKPIKQIVSAIGAVSEGNLSVKVEGRHTGEFGVLVSELDGIIDMLRRYISEISSTLTSFAADDYAVEVKEDYIGDFTPIKTGFEGIIYRINRVMNDIKTASSEVAAGSDQIAAGAQNLANGTSQQTGSIDELSSLIDELGGQISGTLSTSTETLDAIINSEELITQSMTYMNSLNDAMGNIANSSSKISDIIKVIEDIAFQTNILALNAAVEASRAGEAGKGFSVVADEVRNLASKSAEAAKESAALIEESARNVQLGGDIADKTKKSIDGVADISKHNRDGMETLHEAAINQNEKIAMLISNLQSIKDVVQENASTAQESSAQAEEMAAQSAVLNNIVENFKVKE